MVELSACLEFVGDTRCVVPGLKIVAQQLSCQPPLQERLIKLISLVNTLLFLSILNSPAPGGAWSLQLGKRRPAERSVRSRVDIFRLLTAVSA